MEYILVLNQIYASIKSTNQNAGMYTSIKSNIY